MITLFLKINPNKKKKRKIIQNECLVLLQISVNIKTTHFSTPSYHIRGSEYRNSWHSSEAWHHRRQAGKPPVGITVRDSLIHKPPLFSFTSLLSHNTEQL